MTTWSSLINKWETAQDEESMKQIQSDFMLLEFDDDIKNIVASCIVYDNKKFPLCPAACVNAMIKHAQFKDVVPHIQHLELKYTAFFLPFWKCVDREHALMLNTTPLDVLQYFCTSYPLLLSWIWKFCSFTRDEWVDVMEWTLMCDHPFVGSIQAACLHQPSLSPGMVGFAMATHSGRKHLREHPECIEELTREVLDFVIHSKKQKTLIKLWWQ